MRKFLQYLVITFIATACGIDADEPQADLNAEAAITKYFVVSHSATSGPDDTQWIKSRCKARRCDQVALVRGGNSIKFEKSSADCKAGVTIKFEARYNPENGGPAGSKTVTCTGEANQVVEIRLSPTVRI